MTCDAFRVAVLGGRGATEATALHAGACADCRRWLARFAEGEAIWRTDEPQRLAASVIAASTGPACERARSLLAGEPDGPLARLDRDLVAAHLEQCAPCRDVAADLGALSMALPDLAVLDPGPGFTERVLAVTSRRPAAARGVAWWRGRWAVWVARPRFAWEVAYVATLCWVVVLGGPVTAWEWSASKVAAVAERPLPERVLELRVDVPSLKTALVSEAAPRVGAVEGMAARLAGRMVDLWRTGAAWIERLADQVRVALGAAWQRALTWFGEMWKDEPDARTEPGRGAVRSTR